MLAVAQGFGGGGGGPCLSQDLLHELVEVTHRPEVLGLRVLDPAVGQFIEQAPHRLPCALVVEDEAHGVSGDRGGQHGSCHEVRGGDRVGRVRRDLREARTGIVGVHAVAASQALRGVGVRESGQGLFPGVVDVLLLHLWEALASHGALCCSAHVGVLVDVRPSDPMRSWSRPPRQARSRSSAQPVRSC